MNPMIEFLLKLASAHVKATCTRGIPSTISIRKIEKRCKNCLGRTNLLRLIEAAQDLEHTFDDDANLCSVLREVIAHSLERTSLYEIERACITLSLIV